MSRVAAIRGAVQAAEDTPESIEAATRALLSEIAGRNGLDLESVVAVWFTQTPDLRAAYPAATARGMGWSGASFLCGEEPAVEGALPRVVRALVLVDGLPDLDWYGEGQSAVEGSEVLRALRSVLEMGKAKGEVPLSENESVVPEKVVVIRPG